MGAGDQQQVVWACTGSVDTDGRRTAEYGGCTGVKMDGRGEILRCLRTVYHRTKVENLQKEGHVLVLWLEQTSTWLTHTPLTYLC